MKIRRQNLDYIKIAYKFALEILNINRKFITIMTTTEIKSVNQKVGKLYQELNEFFSANYLELARLAYPKQDGREDADAVSEMLTLINSQPLKIGMRSQR